MSLRQIRKLQQHNREDTESEATDSSVESEPVANRRSAFALMRSSSSSSSSSSSEDDTVGNDTLSHDNMPKMISHKASSSKPNPASRKSKGSKNQSEKVTTARVASVLDPVLCLNVRMLNPANELKRIFGSQRVDRTGASSSRNKRGVVIRRRHWLVEPDDGSWPMVVKDVFKMELCSDGSHRLVPELDYENKLRILSRIIITHDIDALYQFVQLYPFNPHGLIQLATILISERSEYETAYQLIRRCLFAIQSSFIPSFHPYKSVILSSDSIFSSCLLRSLLLYAHLLAGQGCSRTSLEVMKLIYAMEGGMSTGAPRTHILLHMDTMAMRAGEYEWLSKFLSTNGLTECLPSSAMLFALAQKRRDKDDTLISIPSRVKKILAENSDYESTDATTSLIRAVLMFPQLSKTVSSVDLPPGVQKKVDPFINKLVQAFVTKGYPTAVRANDDLSKWIDTVLSTVLVESKLSTRNHLQPGWLTEGYSGLTSSEFEWGKSSKGSFIEPASILESEEHVLEVYSDEGFEPRGTRSNQNAPVLTHPVSLESNPVAAFFQTLLPWSTVDHSGTESTPITAGALLEQLRERLGMNHTDTSDGHIIRDARDSDQEHLVSSSEEEEIEME